MNRRRLAAIWAAFVFAASAIPAGAQGGDSAPPAPTPSVTLDRASALPDERVLVTVEGFDGPAVIIAVCGNRAGRGAADCNMVRSQGLGVSRSGPTATELMISAPPAPCPCVIRATATSLQETAVASIDLVGHPVAAIAEPADGRLLSVSMEVRRDPEGLVENFRAWLGGPTAYAVEVLVRNTSATAIDGVVLSGSAGRGKPAYSFPVPDPGSIAPGGELRVRARALRPAPALGKYRWEVIASGAGLPARATGTTRNLPPLLVLLAAGLAADALAFAWRRARSRHMRLGGSA